jgi:phosphomannomutase
LNSNIFHHHSIRGIAGRDLTDEVTTHLGEAIGAFFRGPGDQTLVVGRDAPNSSPRISRLLIVGLLQAGLHVTNVGIVPMHFHHFATDSYEADGGVMVTASCNPPEYNGLKIHADGTLHGYELRHIRRLANDAQVQGRAATPLRPERLAQANPLPEYHRKVKANALFSSSLKIVVDGGNGTNGLIVSQLLSDLGCDVIELSGELDGNFSTVNDWTN